METEENREEQITNEKPKRQYTEEQLEKKRISIKNALERKKELAIIRKAELQKKKDELNEKLNEAKKYMDAKQKVTQTELTPEPEPIPEPEPEKKIKPRKKIVEKKIILEKSDDDEDEEEEVIERIYVKKKAPKQLAPEPDLIEKSNKEMLLQQLKQQERQRVMNDLFSF